MVQVAPASVTRPHDRTSDRVFEQKCAAAARRLEAKHAHGPRYRCASCGTIESAAYVAHWGRDCRECGEGRLEARP